MGVGECPHIRLCGARIRRHRLAAHRRAGNLDALLGISILRVQRSVTQVIIGPFVTVLRPAIREGFSHGVLDDLAVFVELRQVGKDMRPIPVGVDIGGG